MVSSDPSDNAKGLLDESAHRNRGLAVGWCSGGPSVAHVAAWECPLMIARFSSRNVIIVGVVVIALLGGGIGYFTGPTAIPSLRFSPEKIDLTNVFHVSGETLELEVTLRNTSARPIHVTDIPRSCSCMALDTQGRFPIVLEPGDGHPVRLRIYTLGRLGPQPFSISALARLDDGTELPSTEFTVLTNLYGPLIPIPSEFFETVPVSASVTRLLTLADDWPGEGITVKEIKASSADRFRFDLRRSAGTANVLGRVLSKRYELEIQYTPPKDGRNFSETISISIADERVKTLEIPFQGNIERPYEFVPASLTLYGLPGESFQRKFMYRYSNPDCAKIEMAQAPFEFSVSIEPNDEKGTKIITVSGRFPDMMTTKTPAIDFRVGETRQKGQLPITVVRAAK
jgi:hypothetical protein